MTASLRPLSSPLEDCVPCRERGKCFITQPSLPIYMNSTSEVHRNGSIRAVWETNSNLCNRNVSSSLQNQQHFMWWQPQHTIPQLSDSWHSTTPRSVPKDKYNPLNTIRHSLTQNQPRAELRWGNERLRLTPDQRFKVHKKKRSQNKTLAWQKQTAAARDSWAL